MSESEINGIHLSETQRRAAIDLKCQIAATGSAFIQELNSPWTQTNNSTNQSQAFVTNRQALASLPREYTQYLQRGRGDNVIVDSNPNLADGILKYVEDPTLRKTVYFNSRHGVSKELLFNLEKMVGTRDQLAKVLGYNTYSEYTLSSKLIETPEKAMTFLKVTMIIFINNISSIPKILIIILYNPIQQLSNETRDLSDSELNMLYSFKCKTELTGDPVFQWDYEYYSNLIRNKSVQDLNAPTSAELSEYFSLENVLEGMSRVVHQLFGLKLKQIEMRPGESWNKDVIKLALLSRDEGIIGYIYMDLWQRPNKASLGVNYVMELGYRKRNFNLVTGDVPMMEDYNVPKVALVCSFGSKNQTNQFRSLLHHCDLEVMFHEFGHSLHTVLSRGDFQHLCGTRGPVDFVEIPSTLMEHFTWDHKILRQFANHYSSGRTLSSEMINAYKETKDIFKGIETQKLISLAMFDLILHGKHPNIKTPSEIMSILQQKNLKIAGDVGDSFLSGFSHLYFYGSSYYCYLLSKYNSEKIWKNFFGNGHKVNREKGEQYRRKFLQKGSSQTPQSILNHFTA
ncbi:peptidase M3A and M3B domain-containing protein [Heterostelium album PN500]|uniref:Peptidase M3A and M3B domain-containing protein n=1 Tax=Heterostelium pallidum (strain ATCC 26659 / Pp 5 / PN500) TaxID=670386 RepID=D3B895_HETP5|nr:peptidase M3A and M3B domain-containing protein [Heterostelium album PN500]EFA82263.1 peptidase M3A and M3B domain-containing protein [Heterostelium album PN500]|eukprot:XP_020434380.1 peptidase M3A and M3B domain-containing protein [Heterostelium album PN500]